nr:uncharacterized protein LOC111506888 isoform X2 [Leptinotarsa decemlineata]
MVSIKVLIFACTLLVAQTQAYPQATVNGPIFDFIKELLLNGEKSIDKVLLKLDELLNSAISDSIQFQQEIVSVASNGVDKVLDLVNSRLDKIKARGDGNTVKVITCIQNSRDQAKNNVVGLVDRSTKCDLSLAQEVLQSIVDLSPKIQKIKSELFAAVDKIQECDGSNWAEEIKCGADIIKNIDAVISNNKDNVINDLRGLISKIKDLAKEVYPKCLVPNWEIFQDQRFVIINSIAACMTS